MSLLMDALKKAEQEKKKAAEKLKDSVNQDRPESGATLPEEATSEQPKPESARPVRRSVEKEPGRGPGLSLEPIEDIGEITDEFTIVDEGGHPQDDDSGLKLSFDEIAHDRTDEDEFEQTGKQPIPGTVPSIRDTLKEEIDEDRIEGTFYGVELESDDVSAAMYEETLQGDPYVSAKPEQVYDETLPGVSAVELARDIGDENQPTPVAAQTIFAAGASRRATAGFKWTLMVTGLIIIAVIAMGVIVYQNEAITLRELPSPLVARGIEDNMPAQGLSMAVTEPVTGTVIQQDLVRETGGEPVTAMQTTVEEAPVESGVAPQAAPVPALSDEQTTAPAGAPDAEPGVAADSARPGAQDSGAAAVSGVPEAPVAQLLPEEIEVMPALFKISRSKGPDQRGEVINDAYAAYQQGDYAAAKAKYEKIVKDFPDSRDGLLGLGAIAMYEHDWEKAFAVYSRLLAIDPKNSIARAALISLAGESGRIDRESTIKLMLHENPESSFLYFSLGNVYASQYRWAEAQQAFFDAYRFDSTNPDYALNLAIALDRLGQIESALDYYNSALKLAAGRQAGFDEAKVQARIESISAASN